MEYSYDRKGDSPLQQDQQASAGYRYHCGTCGRLYRHKCNLNVHLRYECGKDPQFACNLCAYKAKRKSTLKTHMLLIHNRHPKDL
ncbi:hypothetical protein J6590_014800 [Homalodisca vitripennis]|nr:hypothetical protein J6590_014800 [Homalodisca vitripennis]